MTGPSTFARFTSCCHTSHHCENYPARTRAEFGCSLWLDCLRRHEGFTLLCDQQRVAINFVPCVYSRQHLKASFSRVLRRLVSFGHRRIIGKEAARGQGRRNWSGRRSYNMTLAALLWIGAWLVSCLPRNWSHKHSGETSYAGHGESRTFPPSRLVASNLDMAFGRAGKT